MCVPTDCGLDRSCFTASATDRTSWNVRRRSYLIIKRPGFRNPFGADCAPWGGKKSGLWPVGGAKEVCDCCCYLAWGPRIGYSADSPLVARTSSHHPTARHGTRRAKPPARSPRTHTQLLTADAVCETSKQDKPQNIICQCVCFYPFPAVADGRNIPKQKPKLPNLAG